MNQNRDLSFAGIMTAVTVILLFAAMISVSYTHLGHHRAGCRLTAGEGDLKDSATEINRHQNI